MVSFVGSFWRQNVAINNEESPLVSMQQRPLIVPATLHFSGLPQKSSMYTQEAVTGKTINRTLFLYIYMAEHFLFIAATSLCIVVILPGISVYLREFFSFPPPPPNPLSLF